MSTSLQASVGRSALAGAGATVLWQGVRVALLAVSIVVLARLLEPADYGLMAMVTAIIGIGELLRDMGLSLASVQARTLTAGEKSNLFWINTAFGACLASAAFLLSWPIAELYGRPELAAVTQLLSLTFVLNGVAAQFKAQINRDLRFGTLGAVEAVPQAAGLAVAVALGLTLGDYRALVGQALTVAALALVLDVAVARWRPAWFDRRASVRRLLTFGGAVTGTQSLAYLSKNLDTVLLGLVFGSSQLGFYNRAYQIVVLPLGQLTAPISRVAIPTLSRVQDDVETFGRYVRTGQFFSVAVACTFYGSVIGLAEPLVAVVLGTGWSATAPLLQVLAVSGIFRVMGQVPYWLFLSTGQAGRQFRVYLMAQPVVLVGIVIGLQWGAMGVATGVSAGYAVSWVVQMLALPRATGMPTAGLVRSAAVLAVSIAVPSAAIGVGAAQALPSDPVRVLVGLVSVVAYVAVLVTAVPAYRSHVGTVGRSARRR